MGRVKLKIKKLENPNGRQATYAKRKNGILKKANELSILCDIDILLLMFSPAGKPAICKGKRSIEEVVTKFSQLTAQERAKRKLESLEALKRTFKKLDHEVNIQEFLGTSSQTVEELTYQARLLQSRLEEAHKRLSYWNDIEKINSLDHLEQMENSLKKSLKHIQKSKEDFGEKDIISLESSNKFFNEMQIPYEMDIEQQLQPMSWNPNKSTQHMVLIEDHNFNPNRDAQCPLSSSFGSYSNCQESSVFSDVSKSTSLSLQLGGPCSFPPYNLNFTSDMNLQPTEDINLRETTAEYHINGSFEASRPQHQNNQTANQTWGHVLGLHSIGIYDERSLPQMN